MCYSCVVMNQTAQQSQFKKVFQIELKNISGGIVSIRFRFLGGGSSIIGIDADRAELIIAQIDDALANSSEIFTTPDGRKFEISETFLRKIRGRLQKFCSKSRGGSDAQVVAGGSIEQTSQKQASAPSPKGLTARNFIEPKKCGCHAENAGSKSPVAATAPISASECAAIIGDEVRNAIAPLLVELDSIIALANENLSQIKNLTEQSGRDSAAKLKSRAVALSARGEHLPIKTQHGRTSVVVGTRRVK